MEKKEYWVNERTPENLIRNYLLRNADSVRLTNIQWTDIFKFKKYGTENDPIFLKTINNLKGDFIKKSKDDGYWYYYFRLSAKLKSIFNKETLFWGATPSYSKNFYALEDPTFYKRKIIIGRIITHERIVSLYLTNTEKENLERKNINFN